MAILKPKSAEALSVNAISWHCGSQAAAESLAASAGNTFEECWECRETSASLKKQIAGEDFELCSPSLHFNESHEISSKSGLLAHLLIVASSCILDSELRHTSVHRHMGHDLLFCLLLRKP